MITIDELIFPVPVVNGHKPKISDPYGTDKRGGRGHYGVDVMFPRQSKGQFNRPEMTPWYVLPSHAIPALAMGPGIVKLAKWTTGGYQVNIEHPEIAGVGKRWTVYRHLSSLWVGVGQRVVGGTELGHIGFDPRNGDKAINHLHFELRDPARVESVKSGAIDPAPLLSRLAMRDKNGILYNAPSGGHGQNDGRIEGSHEHSGDPGAGDTAAGILGLEIGVG